MEINPAEVSWRDMYKVMIATVVPRPIAWVSTVSRSGVRNIAPFSFFNVVSANPPVLAIGVNRKADGSPKDTLLNIQETGEFVVNIVAQELAEPMNATSGLYPFEVDEFTVAGLTPGSSTVVQAPRIIESPVNFECQLLQDIELGQGPGGGSLVLGRIVYCHLRDDLWLEGGRVDFDRLAPVGRLGGDWYTRISDTFAMRRPEVKG